MDRNIGALSPKLAMLFLELLPVTGVAVSVMNAHGQTSTIFASDSVAARLDEIHFDLGVGPLFDSFRLGTSESIPDIADVLDTRWPVFAEEAAQSGVRAVFTFPLLIGAVCVGVASTYTASPAALNSEQIERGLSIGRAVASSALRDAVASAELDTPDLPGSPVDMRREIHQATGMVIAQLDVTATEAFSRLRGHAFSSGCTVQETATAVISHQLDFRALPD